MEEKKSKENEKPKNVVEQPEPSSVTVEEINARRLTRAFEVIKDHIARKHRFTFEQMDIGIEISLPVLPPPEQDIFREIARHNSASLWQANWAQFRRNHENGLAFALLLDPGWRSGDVFSLSPVVCEECGKSFTPDRSGVRFCSNVHGAEAERKKLGLPTREEQLAKIAVARSKEERARDADEELRSQQVKKEEQTEIAGA